VQSNYFVSAHLDGQSNTDGASEAKASDFCDVSETGEAGEPNRDTAVKKLLMSSHQSLNAMAAPMSHLPSQKVNSSKLIEELPTVETDS
jgi:hypothetical protein